MIRDSFYDISTLLGLVVLTPIMLFLESKHLSDLPVTQRRLKLTHLASNRCIGSYLLQVLLSRHSGRNSIISSVENLKAQTILFDTQIADLTQVTGVNVGPCISLSALGLADDVGEVSLVLVGLDYVADAEDVDVAVIEAAGEGSRGFLTADLG